MSVGCRVDALSIVNSQTASGGGRTRGLRLRRAPIAETTRDHRIGADPLPLLLFRQSSEHRAFEAIGYVVAVDPHAYPRAVVARDIGTNVPCMKDRVRKAASKVQAMRAGDRADHHDEREERQDAMHAHQKRMCADRVHGRAAIEEIVQEQGLGDEEHDREDRP